MEECQARSVFILRMNHFMMMDDYGTSFSARVTNLGASNIKHPRTSEELNSLCEVLNTSNIKHLSCKQDCTEVSSN